ncbi:hypothetical protein [Levilactobacillus enshiensis]|uniref:hypothetical protein n=1 Tax=Levilactobacillus enshiensis TaxID=2590213 RepID=UPI001179E4F3|nr:hypothetical protein [Levilactobacillus enshiensis]
MKKNEFQLELLEELRNISNHLVESQNKAVVYRTVLSRDIEGNYGIERIPILTVDADMVLFPGKYKSGYDHLFNGYKNERLYALYQGKAFRVWPRG